MLALLMTPHLLTRLVSSQLALTDKRIVGKTGLFYRSYLSLPYNRVDHIHVQQGIFGALLNYGSVTVFSHDGTRTRFSGVVFPYEFQQLADEATEKAQLGRVISRPESF